MTGRLLRNRNLAERSIVTRRCRRRKQRLGDSEGAAALGFEAMVDSAVAAAAGSAVAGLASAVAAVAGLAVAVGLRLRAWT